MLPMEALRALRVTLSLAERALGEQQLYPGAPGLLNWPSLPGAPGLGWAQPQAAHQPCMQAAAASLLGAPSLMSVLPQASPCPLAASFAGLPPGGAQSNWTVPVPLGHSATASVALEMCWESQYGVPPTHAALLFLPRPFRVLP